MADKLIKSLANVINPTTSPGLLDLVLIEQYQSGGDAANPANNTYISSNMFFRDFAAGLLRAAPAGTVGAPAIAFAGYLTTGIYNRAANTFDIVNNGILTASFNAANHVLIGTTTDLALLTVGGTANISGAVTIGSTLTYAGVTATAAVTGTGPLVLGNSPTFTGHPTIEGVTSTGATGSGNLVFASNPTFSGTVGGALTFSGATTFSSSITLGGVSFSAVTGTGSNVLSASPTITGTLTAAAANFSGQITFNGSVSLSAAGTIGRQSTTGLSFWAVTGSGQDFLVYNAAGVAALSMATGTSNFTFAGATTFSGAITYGGVTLSNSVTGTGAMVLNGAPALAGAVTINVGNSSGIGILRGLGISNGASAGGDGAAIDFGSSNLAQTSFRISSPLTGSQTGPLIFSYGNGTNNSFTEAMRITPQGYLLLGSATSTVGASGRGTMEINGTGEGLYGINIGGAAKALFYHTGSALQVTNVTSGPLQFLVNNAEVSRFGADGSFLVGTTTNQGAGYIGCKGLRVNTTGVSITSGELFSITNIAGNGVVAGLQGLGTAAAASTLMIGTDTAGTSYALGFYNAYYGGAIVGSISMTSSATAYNTSSDARLKNVLSVQGNYRDAIKSLWVGDFEWKASGTKGFGVLAQQAYAALGGLGVTKPENDADQWQASAEPFGLLALWGVKDLYNEIENLKSEIARLKAA